MAEVTSVRESRNSVPQSFEKLAASDSPNSGRLSVRFLLILSVSLVDYFLVFGFKMLWHSLSSSGIDNPHRTTKSVSLVLSHFTSKYCMSDALGVLVCYYPIFGDDLKLSRNRCSHQNWNQHFFFSVALGLDPFRKTRFLCFPNVNEGRRKRRISIAISGWRGKIANSGDQTMQRYHFISHFPFKRRSTLLKSSEKRGEQRLHRQANRITNLDFSSRFVVLVRKCNFRTPRKAPKEKVICAPHPTP